MSQIILRTCDGCLYAMAPGDSIYAVAADRRMVDGSVDSAWQVIIDTASGTIAAVSRRYQEYSEARAAVDLLAEGIKRRAGDASGLIFIDAAHLWGCKNEPPRSGGQQ